MERDIVNYWLMVEYDEEVVWKELMCLMAFLSITCRSYLYSSTSSSTPGLQHSYHHRGAALASTMNNECRS